MCIDLKIEHMKKTMIDLGYQLYIEQSECLKEDLIAPMRLKTIFLLSIDVKPRADDDVPSFSPDTIFLDFREFYQFAMGCRESLEPKLQDLYKKYTIMSFWLYGENGDEKPKSAWAKAMYSIKPLEKGQKRLTQCPICRKLMGVFLA